MTPSLKPRLEQPDDSRLVLGPPSSRGMAPLKGLSCEPETINPDRIGPSGLGFALSGFQVEVGLQIPKYLLIRSNYHENVSNWA